MKPAKQCGVVRLQGEASFAKQNFCVPGFAGLQLSLVRQRGIGADKKHLLITFGVAKVISGLCCKTIQLIPHSVSPYMRLFCSIILTIATIAGCAQKHPDTNINKSMTIQDSLTYLALGDSYTIGEAVPQAGSFPYQLAAKLNAQGLKVTEPHIIAVTGWTTDNLIGAIGQSNIQDQHFDVVTLLIGVNDQYQGLSQDHYKANFKLLLQTAIRFAKGNTNHVFVLSIPDYGVTPFAQGRGSIIGPQIDQFNAINRQISQAAGVHYVDVTPISRRAATEPDLIAPDGLHPSEKMYGLWVEELSVQVEKALQ